MNGFTRWAQDHHCVEPLRSVHEPWGQNHHDNLMPRPAAIIYIRLNAIDTVNPYEGSSEERSCPCVVKPN